MALATVDTTPITVQKWTDQNANYAPILAHAGGTVPAASVAVYFFPDGVTTATPPATATGAIAVSNTDATGRVIPPVSLRPGLVYRVTTADGSFTSARFVAGGIVGPVLVPGDNVTGA